MLDSNTCMCAGCGMRETLDRAVIDGWLGAFRMDDEWIDEPICPDCEYLFTVSDDGILEFVG